MPDAPPDDGLSSDKRGNRGWWDRIKPPVKRVESPDDMETPLVGELVRQGALVRLRRHTVANRATFQRWYADHDIARLLRHDLRPLSYVQSLVYFDTVILPGSTRGYTFAIHDRETDELIGSTGLTDFSHTSPRTCYFRILIGESRFWNRGYGTETTRLMMHQAFDELELDHVNLEVFDYNLRAVATYERVGFVQTGQHVEWPARGENELHVIEMRLTCEAFRRAVD